MSGYPAATLARRTGELARRCGDIIDAPGIAECDTPATIFAELMEEIKHSIVNTPRSLQTRIGPSELGEPCSRALTLKLMGTSEPDEGKVPWKAFVGTCMHAEFERIFGASIMQTAGPTPRYLLEKRVTVGSIAGVEITGSTDIFDTLSGTVIDWKSKGKTTLEGHKRHGPGVKYRVQAHSYGLGLVNEGYTVRHVMDVFLPRDGEFRDVIYWAEPFNPQIALDALARAEGLVALVGAYGLNDTLAMFPICNDRWCAWCPTAAIPRANRPGPASSGKSLLGISKG